MPIAATDPKVSCCTVALWISPGSKTPHNHHPYTMHSGFFELCLDRIGDLIHFCRPPR